MCHLNSPFKPLSLLQIATSLFSYFTSKLPKTHCYSTNHYSLSGIVIKQRDTALNIAKCLPPLYLWWRLWSFSKNCYSSYAELSCWTTQCPANKLVASWIKVRMLIQSALGRVVEIFLSFSKWGPRIHPKQNPHNPLPKQVFW